MLHGEFKSFLKAYSWNWKAPAGSLFFIIFLLFIQDLCAQYDGTVRSSVGDIVEFVFGEDGLDPALMEAKDGSVVDFDHVLEHVKNTTKSSKWRGGGSCSCDSGEWG